MPNWSYGDDSTCSGCGVEMEVIGPPGPTHRPGCPIAAHEAFERAERAVPTIPDGRYDCGCMVSGGLILNPCFMEGCVVLKLIGR